MEQGSDHIEDVRLRPDIARLSQGCRLLSILFENQELRFFVAAFGNTESKISVQVPAIRSHFTQGHMDGFP